MCEALNIGAIFFQLVFLGLKQTFCTIQLFILDGNLIQFFTVTGQVVWNCE